MHQLLDERMEQLGLFYMRYMDDIIVLAPRRWKLRKAVRVVNWKNSPRKRLSVG
jgi:hypothetical protein